MGWKMVCPVDMVPVYPSDRAYEYSKRRPYCRRIPMSERFKGLVIPIAPSETIMLYAEGSPDIKLLCSFSVIYA